ncbi:MAG: hypothetical protein WCS77_00780 [Elusimicrobiaceae bacterium]
MPENKTICILAGRKKMYFRAELLATQITDRQGRTLKTEGALPDGEVTEYNAVSVTEKNFSRTRAVGRQLTVSCETGLPVTEEAFQDGFLTGIRVEYFPNGKPKLKEHYKLGKLNGTVTEYYESGNPRLEYMYNARELVSFTEIPDTAPVKTESAHPYKAEPAQPAQKTVMPDLPAAAPVPETTEPAGPLPEQPARAATPATDNFTTRKVEGNVRTYYRGADEIAKEIIAPSGEVADKAGVIPNGVVKEFYPNGKIKVEELYQNGALNGKRIKYDELGRIWAEETYQNGMLDGLVKIHNYFKDKVFEEEAFFKNNKLNGVRKSYYPNGNPSVEETYKEGLLHGVRKSYYENGSINTEENYEHDRLCGTRRRYYDTGQLWNEESYMDGHLHGLRTDFYITGQTRLTENYKTGRLEGERKFFYENGRPMYEETYTYGKLVNRKEFKKKTIM